MLKTISSIFRHYRDQFGLTKDFAALHRHGINGDKVVTSINKLQKEAADFVSELVSTNPRSNGTLHMGLFLMPDITDTVLKSDEVTTDYAQVFRKLETAQENAAAIYPDDDQLRRIGTHLRRFNDEYAHVDARAKPLVEKVLTRNIGKAPNIMKLAGPNQFIISRSEGDYFYTRGCVDPSRRQP